LTFLVILVAALPAPLQGEVGARHPDPAQVVPLHLIAAEHRDSVVDVISNHTLHRQGAPDSFPCNPQIYLSLLNHPPLTLALWRDLSTNNARLRQVGPDRFEGADGNGTTATWDFIYRSPRMHVLLCDLEYVGPRGNTRVTGRIVLIVHTEYFRRGKNEDWVRHNVEAYVKVDSRGWRAVTKSVRPLLEKVLEDQVQEAGLFISLMGHMVEQYPYWASDVAQNGLDIPADVRKGFAALVLQVRRPGANTGRPVVAENETASPARR
jgi:hypothetical protein